MKNNKIITLVKMTVQLEFMDAVFAHARQTRQIIQTEEGCESFTLTTKTEAPQTLVLFAVYKSKEAYDWHLEQDYLKAFFSFLEGKLTGKPEVDFLEEI
jgi:quinol monooxygenase YgiN